MEKERCPIMESDAQNWEAEFDPGLERGLGIYGRKGLDYLKNYRPAVYREMQEGAFLRRHLEETDRLAYQWLDEMLPPLTKSAGATQELKARDPLQWAGLMNSCKAQVEEIIYARLVYA